MKSRAYRYRIDFLQNENKINQNLPLTDRDEMIKKYAPLIKYIAHRLAMRLPSSVSIEDLMSAGILGLIDAISKFDSKKKVKFETYAEYRIRGAMLDELRSLDWVPRSVRHKASQIEKLIEKLENEKGGAVRDEEIASAMGLSIEEYYEEMKEIQGISLLDMKEIKKNHANLSDDEILQLLLDDEKSNPYNDLSLKEMKVFLVQAIQELSEKERQIISLYYYEELTLKEIGEVLNLTESRICQLHNSIILKLRAKLKRLMKESFEEGISI